MLDCSMTSRNDYLEAILEAREFVAKHAVCPQGSTCQVTVWDTHDGDRDWAMTQLAAVSPQHPRAMWLVEQALEFTQEQPWRAIMKAIAGVWHVDDTDRECPPTCCPDERWGAQLQIRVE